MTLVELLVAIFVLTIGIMSVLMFFSAAMKSTEVAQDITLATTHAEYVLEHMRTIETLEEITSTDWGTWINNESIKTLPDENISVTYPDGVEADPLEIKVEVTWTRRERNYNVPLVTQMTR